MTRRENLALGLRNAVNVARDGTPLAVDDVNILVCEALAELLDPRGDEMAAHAGRTKDNNRVGRTLRNELR